LNVARKNKFSTKFTLLLWEMRGVVDVTGAGTGPCNGSVKDGSRVVDGVVVVDGGAVVVNF